MPGIPSNLRTDREAVGASLRQLAGLAGVAPAVLSRAERGLVALTPDQAERVGRALRAFGGVPMPRLESRTIAPKAIRVVHGREADTVGGYLLHWAVPASIGDGRVEVIAPGAVAAGSVAVDGIAEAGELIPDYRGLWFALRSPAGTNGPLRAAVIRDRPIVVRVRVFAESRHDGDGGPIRVIRAMNVESLAVDARDAMDARDWGGLCDPFVRSIQLSERGQNAHDDD